MVGLPRKERTGTSPDSDNDPSQSVPLFLTPQSPTQTGLFVVEVSVFKSEDTTEDDT